MSRTTQWIGATLFVLAFVLVIGAAISMSARQHDAGYGWPGTIMGEQAN